MQVREYIQMSQLGMQIYMFSVTAGELIKNYTIDEYHPETNPTGYQRELIPTIYRDMAKNIAGTGGSVFYPEHITGAINKEDVYVENDVLHIKTDIRIVAEQYMVKGLDYAMTMKNYSGSFDEEGVRKNISEQQLPILLVVIDEDLGQKRYELDMFIRANKSNRGVSVDIASEVKEKMFPEVLDYLNDEKKLYRKIGENIAKVFNEKGKNTIWEGSLYVNIGDNNMAMGLPGFGKSMKPIIDTYVKKTGKLETLEQIKEVESFVIAVVSGAWDIVFNKWRSAFNHYGSFNSNYMIQKAAGVRIIHSILVDCIPNFEVGNKETINGRSKVVTQTLQNFQNLINQSPIESSDWLSGGKLSGYNSGRRVDAVKKYVIAGE